jgi:hypothetical protein
MSVPLALIAVATSILEASGCFFPSKNCQTVPACKFVDLLAACNTKDACATVGTAQVSPSASLDDPTTVQASITPIIVGASASLGPNSSLTVPVLADAATRAALPLLDITFESAEAGLTASSITFDGQPSSCLPAPPPLFDSAHFSCTLPTEVKSIGLQVGDGSVSRVWVILTEPSCTGQTQVCAE